MTTLDIYLAQDRLRALARGESLPGRTNGSALFADISGFTALTEALRNALGPRRGAEELTRQIEAVYSALITQIELFGGSVIDFAGDSMLCWFDNLSPSAPFPDRAGGRGGRSAAQRAVACGQALQQAMRSFASIVLPDQSTTTLTLKVAIASGPARRFVVGDGSIQRLDTLAGATVARTAAGEHLANKGDVLVDEKTASLLGDSLSVKEWRVGEGGARFAVIENLSVTGELPPVQVLDVQSPIIDFSILRPFIHRAVYDREQSGQAAFLTEFRPCVAMFVRFSGIDFDQDSAGPQLDAFICQAQAIVAGHGGTFLQLTIGDKGSYAYINFGALSTHENDARRAVNSALELMETSTLQLQMGITQGPMRVGTYGGKTRKTFGALGDDVNLAARLMTTASAGEILLSSHVHKAVEPYFVFEPRPPVALKGKAETLPVFVVRGRSQRRAVRLQEPGYSLPMAGRTQELQLIHDKLDLTAKGQGQIIGIVAEAGLGKSRLVAEVIRSARRKGFVGYGGACQSDGIHTPYLAWKSIWQAFFDVDRDMPLRKQMRNIEGEIEDRAPARLEALPLLNAVLDLDIPENNFTKNLEPEHRHSALRVLLEDCLRAAAGNEPLLIVVEDLHWVDALSHDLLEELARGLSDCRICFVLAYRPPQLQRLQAPRLEALPNFTRIDLHELTQVEAEQAIRAKLAQLYPAHSSAVPAALLEKLIRRAQGNPFYLEELLNYLRDRGLDPREPQALEKIELPDSLHTLILSRIDQLSEQEKTTLRVASIVGRLFRAAWLTGYYPELGSFPQVKAGLDELAKIDITPLDSPEPELAYLFKHIVTHEVTYESLSFATRAGLHEQLARYLENMAGASLLDTITFHYGRSDNTAKKREYYRKAAEAAYSVSAFVTAVEYSTRLLELTPDDDPARSALALDLAEMHFRLGDFPAAQAAAQKAEDAAQNDVDRASALAFLGTLLSSRLGEHREAQKLLEEAVPLARKCKDPLTLCRALHALGTNLYDIGKLDEAQIAFNESLSLARDLGDGSRELLALNRLGMLAERQGDYDEAERLFQEMRAQAVVAGNREREFVAIGNLGVLAADDRKDYAAAQEYFRQAMVGTREIGAQDLISTYLLNLAITNIMLGELAAARAELRDGLALALRLGYLRVVLAAVMVFGQLAHAEGQTERAVALLGLARQHYAWSDEHQHNMDTLLAEWGLDPSVVEAGLTKGAGLGWDATIQELLEEHR
ncbi:MAG TPA: tetratricopeptide repeat protein [Anaerolineales bacterium]|nr:tetratricopeptide repeat protein [Anaerolineales bacterium]